MPDRDTLGRIGFAAVPAWWQVRHAGSRSYAHRHTHDDAASSQARDGGSSSNSGGGGRGHTGAEPGVAGPERAVGLQQLPGHIKRHHVSNRSSHDRSNGHGGYARNEGSRDGDASYHASANGIGNNNGTATATAPPARAFHIKGRAGQHSTRHGRIDRRRLPPRWTRTACADRRDGERDAEGIVSVPPRPSAMARFAAAVKPRFAAATRQALAREPRAHEGDLIEL